ncbi:hypothetical protein [Hymenobacter canadensis]|uniref:Uncharacterized protein n=1 Tax=Hymenobacter canadensis TaxID=2999067 RepID=A0ABY7LUK2_9BACT|nr:hypothetical protein [Hymenobacter canadensis]WBA43186.1 hypothetical protein O3303_06380 [Hymenobacter canadensis]
MSKLQSYRVLLPPSKNISFMDVKTPLMKQLILAASLTFLSFTAFAQGKTTSQLLGAATSQEEYNYATKGLKTQRAQGLDLKAGYLISNKTSLPGGGGSTVTIEDLVLCPHSF